MTATSSETTAPAGPAPFVVLASRSPQRAAILRQLGLSFRIVPSRHHENHLHGDPVTTVVDNAVGKAREVAGREAAAHGAGASRGAVDPGPGAAPGSATGHLVLGVDTVVALDGHILGKASSADEAASYVARLAGRTHDVFSGLCLIGPDGREWTGHARTAVTFRALTPGAVASYVATGEWRERAGAYAIQGVGSALVTAVEGDYWNVVGLPVALLLNTLEELGVAPCSWLAAGPPPAGHAGSPR